MSSQDDPLGEKLDRVERTATRAFGFFASAALGGLAVWKLLYDDSPIHDGHIAAVLIFLAAVAVGLFAWGWPLIPKPKREVGWKRLWEFCMALGALMFMTAMASVMGVDPMEMWLAYALIGGGCFLFLVALLIWLRNRDA
jgi:hypothetical protein